MLADDFELYCNPYPGRHFTIEQYIETIKQGKIVITTSRGKKLVANFSDSFIKDYRTYNHGVEKCKQQKNNAL